MLQMSLNEDFIYCYTIIKCSQNIQCMAILSYFFMPEFYLSFEKFPIDIAKVNFANFVKL